MWSARQSRKMGRRVAGLLGGLLVGLLLVAAPAAASADPINLSNSASASGSPAIAVNGAGRVFVAWKEGNAIFFRRSQPTQGTCGGGLKFDEMPVSLWAGPVAPSRPALAANDTEVFVAWQASSAVWFNRSTNDGQTFFDPVPPSPVNLGSSSSALNVPSVAADDAGRVFVAWSNGSFPAEIFLSRSTSSVFESAANVSGTPFHSRAPSLATDGTNIFLAWEEWASGPFGFFNASILHKKFSADVVSLADVASLGATNLSSVLFPTGLGRAFSPNVAFRDGLSVVFGTSNGPSFYHRSSSDGMNFNPPENVSGAMSSLSPSDARAARRNGSAMVAWSEELAGNAEIRYRLLGNGAMVSPDTFAPTPGRSASPAAAMDSTGRLLVAWQETVNANDEIYLSYDGGTGGDEPNAWVEMTPQTLNAKTIEKGVGVFTLRIGFLDGSAVNYLDSLVLNGNPVTPLRSSLVDTDGNGSPDTLELKIERSKLQPVLDGATLTAAQRNGNDPVNYTVKGNMTGGSCFSSRPGEVRIIHQ